MVRETLILFTRFPVAGRAKTRLIARLGAEGAAQLQREMTEHALARVWPLVKRRGVDLEIRFEDGSAADMRRWLGSRLSYVPQGSGDLGERMSRASAGAFAAGAHAVVIIGADCPELDASLVGRALDALRTNRLVFGPAKDGGYYLVGLNAAAAQVFESIPWSTSDVLSTSIVRAREIGVEAVLLPELSDVDGPADLEVWEKSSRMSRAVSVIIPTLNEAERLPITLRHVAIIQPAEIIVADGGSHDHTVGLAQFHGAKVANCAANRAQQMNAGAAMARSETLLFLHADTLLPETWHDAVLAALRQPDVVGGAFGFRIRDPFGGRWLIESTTNLRSRCWQMPYGDQALFVRRWAFDELGGFPDQPIMEDYEFVRRLRRLGKLALLNASVITSGRRWHRLGFFRATLINKFMVLGYRCGVSPTTLAAFYRGKARDSKPRPLNPEALSQSRRTNESV